MKSIKINVFTMDNDFEIQLNSSNDTTDFLKIFNHEMNSDDDRIIIHRVQQKNPRMIEHLNNFVEKHNKKIPALHKIKANLNRLKDEEYFIVLINSDELTQENMLKTFYEVEELNGVSSVKEKHEQLRYLFANVLENYNMTTFSEHRKNKLGESNKELRKCRFCFKGKKDGATFFNEAHAISEALGNKMFIQFEECDECNSYFEKNVEKHLIKYLDIFRTFFGVKNKENNIPTIKGENFEYRQTDDKQLIIQHLGDTESIDDHDISKGIPLKFHDKINEQNIYKTLVKFAIGIMKPEDMLYLKKTIEWVRSDQYIEKLPLVGIINDYQLYTDHPKMVVYIRKNENSNMPYAIGEFHFTFFTFVFIIPVFEKNEKDFLDEHNYNSIWEIFKHYKNRGMRFEDFSNSNERELQINLKFEQIQETE